MLGNGNVRDAGCSTLAENVVGTQLGALDIQISLMEGLLGELFTKLGPVRNQIPIPESVAPQKPEPMRSPIANQIVSAARKIEVYNLAIKQILKEIEV